MEAVLFIGVVLKRSCNMYWVLVQWYGSSLNLGTKIVTRGICLYHLSDLQLSEISQWHCSKQSPKLNPHLEIHSLKFSIISTSKILGYGVTGSAICLSGCVKSTARGLTLIKKNSVALVRYQTMPTKQPPLVGEVVPTFADRGCCVVSAMDPPVVSLGFLDRSRYYFFQVAPRCPREAEWTPLQSHCFSENLEAPGIEPRTYESVARNSDH
jgi:hypothetical protein